MDTSLLNPDMFQFFLTEFAAAMNEGLAAFRPFLTFLLSALVLLDATALAVRWLDHGVQTAACLGFLLRLGLLTLAIGGWADGLHTLLTDAAHAGLRLSGSTLTPEAFLNPGSFVANGLTAAQVLLDTMEAHTGWRQVGLYTGFFVAFVVFMVSYSFMAVHVFFVQLEVLVLTPVSLIALTFLAFGPLRSMAAGVLGYPVHVAVQFFLQAVLAGIIHRLAPRLFPPLPAGAAAVLTIKQSFLMVLAAVVLAYLFVKIPTMVARHFAGALTLTGGSAVQQVVTTYVAATRLASGRLVSAATAAAAAAPRASQTPGPTRPRPASPRTGPPPMSTAQALHAGLRAGAQWLGHEPHGGGPHVEL
jgi:type IV secretory pathway TrbL component